MRTQTPSSRVSQRESGYLALLLGLAVTCCAPDFDSLSRGTAGGGGEAAGHGGAAGQLGGGGQSGALLGAAGEAGGAALDPCQFSHPEAVAFDGFDGGLSGPGFALASSTSSISTAHGSTASTAWDATVGSTCPGSLRLTAVFKGYSTSTTVLEKAIGDLRFSAANWTGAALLHVHLRVDPATAPVQSIRLFTVSGGTAFLYDSIDDDTLFRDGEWNEVVFPLKAGATFDPASVARIGIDIILEPAGFPGNPTSPPVVSAWLDDVWVE